MKARRPYWLAIALWLGLTSHLHTQSFASRPLKAEFGIVVTAAHQARLAQIEGGYPPARARDFKMDRSWTAAALCEPA